jgi:hypothetical protein
MTRLPGFILKLDRGYHHLMNARAQIDEFVSGNPYQIVRDDESEPGKSRIWITLLEEPPDLISLAAGDAAHNFRSALDHLVYEISSQKKREPRGTSFPILTSENDWDKRTEKGKLQVSSGSYQTRYLPDAARALIQSLQPCPRPEPYPPDMFGPDRQRLLQLRNFDNADKHKQLNVAVFYVQHVMVGHSSPTGLPDWDDFHRGGPLQLNTPTLLIQFAKTLEVDVDPIVMLDVTFSDGYSPREPVGTCLDELFVCVRAIIGALGRFC